MEQIRKYFERSVAISDADWELFASKLVRRKFRKKQDIVTAGETENHLSFIETGIVRFYIPQEDNDVTFFFSFGGEFVSAYNSFLTRQPCSYTAGALTDTVLWSVSYDDLQQIYAETTIGNEIGRLACEKIYLDIFEREISFLTMTAKERYLQLFEKQPHLPRQIPLKYIASYIGITPQALSRIRRQIS